ncbi:hypothetical protein [Oceanicella actignis]|uniref:Uncharacterized protein n=1 Tax=Oceanicella actignis TaxID=1189325 RepID=A0A1M7TJM4_9RHOB|nr:hypothetical protein [Oceanicella actignis]SET66796.1 hypothetical protein SAMN04488119_10754 [Oceanicella actignis]SHN70920.1 hypothetical protein SAMN05216200_10753 [Oceanicella actignis]
MSGAPRRPDPPVPLRPPGRTPRGAPALASPAGAGGAAAARRWIEPAIAGALSAGALWLGGRTLGLAGPIHGWIGWPLLALGAGLGLWFWAAVQRARLQGAGGGASAPGLVEVDERRIVYMGPVHGGAAALEAIAAIDVLGGADPVWLLRLSDGSRLAIPARAHGAEALPEAFAALPGFSTARAAQALAGAGRRRVWRR